MAAIYEPLLGKRKALSTLLAQVCRHRHSLTVYLAIEPNLLPCGRKHAGRIPGSIAIICRSSQNIFSSFRLLGAEVTRSHVCVTPIGVYGPQSVKHSLQLPTAWHAHCVTTRIWLPTITPHTLPEMPYTCVDMTWTYCLMDIRTWYAEYRNNALQCADALRHPWLAAAGRPARYTVT